MTHSWLFLQVFLKMDLLTCNKLHRFLGQLTREREKTTLAPSKWHHTVVWKGSTEINGQVKTSRSWQRTAFVLLRSDSKTNSINSVHTNVVKFWHHQSSVVHRFVLKKTEHIHNALSMTTIHATKPAGIQEIQWFKVMLDHNNCITCWFFPYCLCRFQGKGQRLVCRLPQINCIAAGLLVSQLPDGGTENFVPPPSEGIHEIWPSWYLSWCWSSFGTLRLQVCWCNVPDMYSIYCMEMKPAVVTVVRDVSATDKGKVDSKK